MSISEFTNSHTGAWVSAKTFRWMIACCSLLLVTLVPASAQTFTTLANFDDTNGAYPYFMEQGGDGNLWGTTFGSGATYCGTVFDISVLGTLSTADAMTCSPSFPDGNEPQGVIQGTDGNFYGVTFFGGSTEQGSIYRLTPDGVLTTLVSFNERNGGGPVGTLTEGNDGNFYGVTYAGGTHYGWGTVFKVTPDGVLTTLHKFDFTHGSQPYAGVIQGTDGSFYGITYSGGASGSGIFYRITSQGQFAVIYNFSGQAGQPSSPVTPLVQGNDGNFYGTTSFGGTDNDGTVFRITPTGTLTTLHNFIGPDGYSPGGPLFLASDGNFWGTTAYNTTAEGTIFKITPAGTLTTMYVFSSTDGQLPVSFIQDTNGIFYGSTDFGGPSNVGTIFSFDDGLKPFVALLSTSGKVGATIGVLGQGLKTTQSVSFNGRLTTFTVVSDDYLTAKVPTGATNGFVTVQTSAGTLRSNQRFVITAK